MNSLTQFKTTTLLPLVAVTFACFGSSPIAQALVPPPDGGYANQTTAEGKGALNSVTLFGRGAASNNTALGFDTLFHDTTGRSNTAVGSDALVDNVAGNFNTATGAGALFHNTATGNTADGYQALFSNVAGNGNTAIGSQALYHNIGDSDTGFSNTAVGGAALYSNTTGIDNVAIGTSSLQSNMVGCENVAVGAFALFNSTGIDNVAIGGGAGGDLITGDNNIALGNGAGGLLTAGSNNIDIGNAGVAAESNTIRIGEGQTATYIAGIHGATASGGAAVYVNSDGRLGTSPSSERFKQDIRAMGARSDALLALRPVTFRYKRHVDPQQLQQFGLVAEEVDKVNSDLVARDRDGKPYTVRYEAVNAMLLNEFLKEHRKVQELETLVKALTASLQKVSAKLDANRPAPHVAVNGSR
jgi:Chaperone of endosialidase